MRKLTTADRIRILELALAGAPSVIPPVPSRGTYDLLQHANAAGGNNRHIDKEISMHRIIALAFLILLAPMDAHADDPPLFHLAVSDVPVENGKVLNMEFQEVSREDDTSTVQITWRSGGSVSSSMFILRGMCGLARSRGKQHFVPEKIVGESNRYLVKFPATLPESGKVFTTAQCDLMWRY